MAENFDTGKEVIFIRQGPVLDLNENLKDSDEQFSKLTEDSGSGVFIPEGIDQSKRAVKDMDKSCNHAGYTVFYFKKGKLDADQNVSELQNSVIALKQLRDLDFKYPSYMAAQKESFDRNWLGIKQDISETIIPASETVIGLISRLNHKRSTDQPRNQILAQLDSLSPLFEPLLERLDKLNDQFIAIGRDRLQQEVPANKLPDAVPAWRQTLDKISWNADSSGRECTQLEITCFRLFPDSRRNEMLAGKQLLEKRLEWLKTSVHDLDKCPEIDQYKRLALQQQMEQAVIPAFSAFLTQAQIYENNPRDEEKRQAALSRMPRLAHLAAGAFNDLARASETFKREAILDNDGVFTELHFNYGRQFGTVEYFKTGMAELSKNLDSLEEYLTSLRSLATKDSWTEKDAERFSVLRDLILDRGRDIRKAGTHPYAVEIEGEPIFANWMFDRLMMNDQLLPVLANVYELANKQNVQVPDLQLNKQIIKAANAAYEKTAAFKSACAPVFARAKEMETYPLADKRGAPNEIPWIDTNISTDVRDILPAVDFD